MLSPRLLPLTTYTLRSWIYLICGSPLAPRSSAAWSYNGSLLAVDALSVKTLEHGNAALGQSQGCKAVTGL